MAILFSCDKCGKTFGKSDELHYFSYSPGGKPLILIDGQNERRIGGFDNASLCGDCALKILSSYFGKAVRKDW